MLSNNTIDKGYKYWYLERFESINCLDCTASWWDTACGASGSESCNLGCKASCWKTSENSILIIEHWTQLNHWLDKLELTYIWLESVQNG